jgi:hypothetical protein
VPRGSRSRCCAAVLWWGRGAGAQTGPGRGRAPPTDMPCRRRGGGRARALQRPSGAAAETHPRAPYPTLPYHNPSQSTRAAYSCSSSWRVVPVDAMSAIWPASTGPQNGRSPGRTAGVMWNAAARTTEATRAYFRLCGARGAWVRRPAHGLHGAGPQHASTGSAAATARSVAAQSGGRPGRAGSRRQGTTGEQLRCISCAFEQVRCNSCACNPGHGLARCDNVREEWSSEAPPRARKLTRRFELAVLGLLAAVYG